jgi:hypothetical protein
MASKRNITTDHDFIRRWAEERKGKPSRVSRFNKLISRDRTKDQ